MVACVGISGVRRDYVTDPTEQASRADPQAWRDDEPQNTGQDAPIVELSNSGDEQA
jgi:hypothetical protein